jgi:uncharacterized protein (DUF433 family)
MRRQLHRAVAIVIVVLLCGGYSFAHSVLTHEEIVDLVWTDEIRPLLLQRYPGLTEEQITEAHAYAYGGAVIQDLGYYPFGSEEFSNLVHYVRSGDFVKELLLESQDANEYAFALGALSHYASDLDGHPAVNRAVAIGYPKLRAKYGNSVRYAQDKTAHLKTEFGFDMVQVAKNRYASKQYHDFIGFKVSKPLLERVFPVVYGVDLNDVLAHEDLAIGSYRFAISQLIPKMTQVALRTHKKDLMRETPNFAKRKFLYRLSRSGYEKEWGKDYTKPGFGTRLMAVLLQYMPKIGPFRAMAFDSPTAQTEDLYFKSINSTVDQYRALLKQVGTDSLVLPNRDFDTGNATKAAEYSLTDDSYAKLLGRLSDRKFDRATPELKANIVEFYSDLSASFETKKDAGRWQNVLKSLAGLQSATPSTTAATGSDQASEAVSVAKIPITPPNPIVIGFVGGLIKHDNLVHSEVQLAARLRKDYPSTVNVETFESYSGDKALKRVLELVDTDHDGSLADAEKQNARIIIYGHSWGGSEAITLARALDHSGIPVALTIQIDSVTKWHEDDHLIPANVARAANFYQLNGLLHGRAQIQAADPARTNIIGNFRFDYKSSPYNCRAYPWYDRFFVKAHTQIECDPRVWAQAETLIRSDLPKMTNGLQP